MCRIAKEEEKYNEEVAAYPGKVAEYEVELARLHKAQDACDLFTLGTAEQEAVDLRMKDLSAARKYIKTTHIPFATLDGKVLPKAADWYLKVCLCDECVWVSM